MTLLDTVAAEVDVAELELAAAQKQAEGAMEKAIDAQEAVVTAAENVKKLRAALGALKGETPTQPDEAPTPTDASVAAQAAAAAAAGDPLANRSADFGEPPPVAAADAAGNVRGVHQEPGYVAEPQPLVDHSGQPIRKRRDNPQALAEQQSQKGPACPGCGKHGTLSQYSKNIGDRGPFFFVGCGSCGSERMIG
jgi:hypothetical protein